MNDDQITTKSSKENAGAWLEMKLNVREIQYCQISHDLTELWSKKIYFQYQQGSTCEKWAK